MELQLSVPKELEAQAREELDRHHIEHTELVLKSFTAPAVFYLASTAFQDIGTLVMFCQLIAAQARTHRKQKASSPNSITSLHASDIEHVILTFPDGTHIDLETVGELELKEILARKRDEGA